MQEQQTVPQRPTMAIVNPIIRLHEADNVVVARATLLPGTPVGDGINATQRVPPGHKAAVRRIEDGESARKYNQITGFATQAIAPGEHVHIQNMGMGDFAKDYAYGVDAKPTDYVPEPATFEGIVRPDGRVATRQLDGLISRTTVTQEIA
jgi:altronate hydrolase